MQNLTTTQTLTHNQKIEFYLTGLNQNLADSLLIFGPPGCGKSTAIMNFMEKHHYNPNEHFIYLQNYITPIELFKKLQKVNELQKPQTLILDDIEDCLKSTQIIGILKGALWGVGKNKQRIICWNSGSIKDKEKKEFIFTGKIVMIVNKIDKVNPLIKAIMDRGFYYGIEFTKIELTSLIQKHAQQPYKDITPQSRAKIADYLIQNSNLDNLSLRLLQKAYNLFILSPHHWKELLKENF